MKRIVLLIFIFSTMFCSKAFAQEEGRVYILNENVGVSIDPEEREYYQLFPYVTGYKSAVFIKLDDGSYRVIFTITSKGKTKLQFKDYTENEIDSMSERIDSIGSMKRKEEKSLVSEEKIEKAFVSERHYIENNSVEITLSGYSGGNFIDGSEDITYSAKVSAGLGFFLNRVLEIGIKGTGDKIKGKYGSGAVLGTLTINIPTSSKNVYLFLGGSGGYLMSGVYNTELRKNDLDFDSQAEAFCGGKFFISSGAALILQPYYMRTFNAGTVKDVIDFGISYGVSLFF